MVVRDSSVNGIPYSSLRVASLNSLNNPDRFVEFRLPSLVEELSVVDPDVVLFQEAIYSYKDELTAAMSSLGYVSAYYAEPEIVDGCVKSNGTAVFCKSAQVEFSTLHFHDPYGSGFQNFISSSVASFQFAGRTVHLLSNHFVWMGKNERYRLAQARQVTLFAAEKKKEDPSCVVVLGGDLNATEASDTIRYLQGLSADVEGRFEGRDVWVDAWEVAGSEENYVTSAGGDYWGSITAKSVGFPAPALMPSRRIDYLMVFGWVYGNTGCPVNFGRFADRATGDAREISDHYGIFADIAFF